MSEKMNEDFLQSVADVLEKAQKNAKAAIDLSMVYAYFETGREKILFSLCKRSNWSDVF